MHLSRTVMRSAVTNWFVLLLFLNTFSLQVLCFFFFSPCLAGQAVTSNMAMVIKSKFSFILQQMWNTSGGGGVL